MHNYEIGESVWPSCLLTFLKPLPQPSRYLYFLKGVHVYTDCHIVADDVGSGAAFFEYAIAERDGGAAKVLHGHFDFYIISITEGFAEIRF